MLLLDRIGQSGTSCSSAAARGAGPALALGGENEPMCAGFDRGVLPGREADGTDWRAIAGYYDAAVVAPSPVVELNRAVAHAGIRPGKGAGA